MTLRRPDQVDDCRTDARRLRVFVLENFVYHTHSDRIVGFGVDQNEAAGFLVVGIAIDRDDRVYVTTVTGVQVFDPKGQYLGTIKVGRQPANAAFAGADKQTLYITAREGLYRVRTLAKGPDRLGK